MMTKTEMKKQLTKVVIEHLINKYNAEVEDEGFGRFHVQIGKFTGDLDRRDLQIGLWDSIPLHGDGFTLEERLHQQASVALEDQINNELKSILASQD